MCHDPEASFVFKKKSREDSLSPISSPWVFNSLDSCCLQDVPLWAPLRKSACDRGWYLDGASSFFLWTSGSGHAFPGAGQGPWVLNGELQAALPDTEVVGLVKACLLFLVKIFSEGQSPQLNDSLLEKRSMTSLLWLCYHFLMCIWVRTLCHFCKLGYNFMETYRVL